MQASSVSVCRAANGCVARGWPVPPAFHGLGRSVACSFHTSTLRCAGAASWTLRGRRSVSCEAAGGEVAKEVYQGRFGPWSVEAEDVREVWGYRVGLSIAAAAILIASSLAFLPEDSSLRASLLPALDPLCVVGAAGLGVSLQLIHIYVAPLKKALQALWLVGTLAGLYLMATQDAPAVMYVADNPWTVWLVGPLFAALTGVAFKEGFCYNKWEAAGLFGTVPILMLSHLFQAPEEGQRGMLAAMCIMMTVFAARKYTQPLKDDIGDKSVFMWLAASPEEQQRMMGGSAFDTAEDS